MRSFLAVLVVLSAAAVAQADQFSFYGRGGYAVQGYTIPNYYTGGYRAYGYDTGGRSFNFSYQPSYQPYYPAYNYYRAPVLNDYYRQSPSQGYGFKGW